MQSATSNIDWNLAKALRAQGLKWEDIAEQFGTTAATLRVKASRQGWARINKTTANILEQVGQQTIARTIQESAPKLAEAWLSELQTDTVDSLKSIRKLQMPKTLAGMKQREEMLLTHTKRGRAGFGLDDQSNSRPQVQIMAQLVQLMDSPQSLQAATVTATDDTTPLQDASHCTVDV